MPEMTSVSDLDLMLRVNSIAEESNDRSTHIGAVLTTTDGGLFEDCNRTPDGVSDQDDVRHERPTKYLYFEHAERNVIFQAAKLGVSTQGATLYTTGIPCADCCRAVIQSGISRVCVWKRGSGLESTDRWFTSIQAGKTMLEEAGVEISEITPEDFE